MVQLSTLSLLLLIFFTTLSFAEFTTLRQLSPRATLTAPSNSKISWNVNGKRASLGSFTKTISRHSLAKSGGITQEHVNTCVSKCQKSSESCTFAQLFRLSDSNYASVVCSLHATYVNITQATIPTGGKSMGGLVVMTYGLRNLSKVTSTTTTSQKSTTISKPTVRVISTSSKKKSTTSSSKRKSTTTSSTKKTTSSKKSTTTSSTKQSTITIRTTTSTTPKSTVKSTTTSTTPKSTMTSTTTSSSSSKTTSSTIHTVTSTSSSATSSTKSRTHSSNTLSALTSAPSVSSRTSSTSSSTTSSSSSSVSPSAAASANTTSSGNSISPAFPASPKGGTLVQLAPCTNTTATVPMFVNNQYNSSTTDYAYIVQHGHERGFSTYFSTIYKAIGTKGIIIAPNSYIIDDPVAPDSWYQPDLNLAWADDTGNLGSRRRCRGSNKRYQWSKWNFLL